MQADNDQPLDYSFYEQPTIELAKNLLGCLLIKQTDAGTAAGIIVETEAYMGPEDRAAHSYMNRRTKRTEVMFGPPGYTYMYTMHTHNLFNIVSGEVEKPEAVLVRAVDPYYNLELIKHRRNHVKNQYQLTNGPGKLTKALGITLNDYGHLVTQEPLWISKGNYMKEKNIESGPRIGIDNAGPATHYPWRFWIKDNPYVSKPRPKSI